MEFLLKVASDVIENIMVHYKKRAATRDIRIKRLPYKNNKNKTQVHTWVARAFQLLDN